MRRHVDQLRVVMGGRRVGRLSSGGRRGIFFQYDNAPTVGQRIAEDSVQSIERLAGCL